MAAQQAGRRKNLVHHDSMMAMSRVASLSGIWQSVWIERRVADHIARARITPDWETGQVAIRVFPAEPALSEARLRLSVFGPDGEPVVAAEALLPSGGNEAEL